MTDKERVDDFINLIRDTKAISVLTRQSQATGAICMAFRLGVIDSEELANIYYNEISAWQIPACGPSAAQSITTGQPAIAIGSTQKPQAGM